MKKFLMLAVVCAFATSLVGCDSGTPSKPATAPAKNSDAPKTGGGEKKPEETKKPEEAKK